MTSQYPDRIDNFSSVSGTDPMTDHAQRHDNEQDGIEQVQLTLGTNPQGAFGTVRDRLNAADTTVANAVADLAAEEEKVDEHTFDIAYFGARLDAIEEYLGAVPTKEVRGRGQWALSADKEPPPNTTWAITNSLVFTEITELYLNQKDLLSSTTTGMKDTRPGDRIALGKANSFGVSDTGTYLVREFETQNSKGEVVENGDIYYMELEYEEDDGGSLQEGFGTIIEMYKFGMRFTK